MKTTDLVLSLLMESATSLMFHLLKMLTAKQVCLDIVMSVKGSSLCLIDIDQKTTSTVKLRETDLNKSGTYFCILFKCNVLCI